MPLLVRGMHANVALTVRACVQQVSSPTCFESRGGTPKPVIVKISSKVRTQGPVPLIACLPAKVPLSEENVRGKLDGMSGCVGSANVQGESCQGSCRGCWVQQQALL